MGRIPERNPRFRTKEEIVRDMAFVLNAPLTYGTQEAVLREACWVWTEFDGKYEGCAYWSKAAMIQKMRYLKHKMDYFENPSANAKPTKVKLIHEHVVPKQVICELLRKLSPATPESVRGICDKFLIGAVITCEEDARLNTYRQSMPPEFIDSASADFQNPWLRYKRCEIEILPHPPGW
jgi:hypothetical protein